MDFLEDRFPEHKDNRPTQVSEGQDDLDTIPVDEEEYENPSNGFDAAVDLEFARMELNARQFALQLAQAAYGNNSTVNPDTIVERAEKYFDFLNQG